jgi:hypothetical protein
MRIYVCLLCLCLVSGVFTSNVSAQGMISVKGVVYDTDSITPIAFVYAINRNSLNGTMTDAAGHFEVNARLQDTLIFSYLGYEIKRILPVTLKDSVKNSVLRLKIVLIKKVMNLQEVIIMSKEFTKEEKQYYTSKVEEYERFKSQGISSPITGLYMAFSKEGKSMKKLTAMYDELLYDELLEKRLSDAKLREVTGNENLDCKAFRNFCRLSDNFLSLASEYDLFEVVVKIYRDYSTGKKPYNRVKQGNSN